MGIIEMGGKGGVGFDKEENWIKTRVGGPQMHI
jgi:hypothetical protein